MEKGQEKAIKENKSKKRNWEHMEAIKENERRRNEEEKENERRRNEERIDNQKQQQKIANEIIKNNITCSDTLFNVIFCVYF